MMFLLVSPVSLGEDARVIVLIENENSRNTVMFQEHFLPVMLRIFERSSCLLNILITWHYDRYGEYFVKWGYHIARIPRVPLPYYIILF